MKIRQIILLFTISAVSLFGFPSLGVSETDNCQQYTPEVVSCKSYPEQELTSIRTSNNPRLMMGAGVMALVMNSESPVGKDLLSAGSQIESPKGVVTVSFIINQLNNNLPLSPLQNNIVQLIRDDKDNAVPYYLNAILQGEKGLSQESLSQIQKGNTKIFNSYPRQRFYAIVEAGEIAKCRKIQAQRYALWNSLSTSLFIKARHLCQKLIETNGQEAKDVCSHMGQNLERSSITIIDKLNSLSIQLNALDNSPSNSSALIEVKNRRDKALNCDGRKMEWSPIPEANVTEEADLKYAEIYLDAGECSALEFLHGIVKRCAGW